MTNGSAHTPPPPPTGGTPYGATPPPPAKKKGLPPLAWVGIGCGALVLLVVIALAIAAAMGLSWLGGKAKEFEDNPAMAAAKLMVQANPEVELVEADDEAGTLTIRNKETGEVMTVGLDQVEQGRITFESDGETVTMGMEEGEDGEGAFTVRDKEGKATFRVGAGGEDDIPAWVPRYEGVELQGTYFSSSGGEVSGGYSFETSKAPNDVLDWYRSALEEEGLSQTGSSNSSAGGSTFSNLTYEADGRTASVVVTGEEGGTTNVVVSYSAPVEQ